MGQSLYMNGIKAESSDVLLAIPAYDGNEMTMTIMRHSARILMQLPAHLTKLKMIDHTQYINWTGREGGINKIFLAPSVKSYFD